MKQFIKKTEGLQLVNGGYLSNKEGEPVYNAEFVAAQKRAQYIVTFAKHASGKTFEVKEADCVSDVIKAVNEELSLKATKYVDVPKEVKRELTDKLAAEALSFMDFTDGVAKSEKINSFLQEFNVLHEFEEFGLFFESDIVKLNAEKLYSMSDVVKAVTETIDLLD